MPGTQKSPRICYSGGSAFSRRILEASTAAGTAVGTASIATIAGAPVGFNAANFPRSLPWNESEYVDDLGNRAELSCLIIILRHTWHATDWAQVIAMSHGVLPSLTYASSI